MNDVTEITTDPRLLQRQVSHSELPNTQDTSFWQYNKQQKGPRGMRYELTVPQDSNDPHDLAEFRDPVFDDSQQVRINHVGKARKGDGTDITPKPERLYGIGTELVLLNERMAELGKKNENWARKEKNRLASK